MVFSYQHIKPLTAKEMGEYFLLQILEFIWSLHSFLCIFYEKKKICFLYSAIDSVMVSTVSRLGATSCTTGSQTILPKGLSALSTESRSESPSDLCTELLLM